MFLVTYLEPTLRPVSLIANSVAMLRVIRHVWSVIAVMFLNCSAQHSIFSSSIVYEHRTVSQFVQNLFSVLKSDCFIDSTATITCRLLFLCSVISTST